MHRHLLHTELERRLVPGLSDDDDTLAIHDDRLAEPELLQAAYSGIDVLSSSQFKQLDMTVVANQRRWYNSNLTVQEIAVTNPSSKGSISLLVDRLQEGDSVAATDLWEQFLPRLLGLARRTLANHPRLNGFADDVVQSVFGSFFRRVQGGEYSFDDQDDVWSLLAVITVRKAGKMIRRECAEKRGGGQVVNTSHHTMESASSFEPVDPSQLGPEFDLYAEEMLNGLPDELRTVAVLRLMGHTNPEIARQLDWTLRKVERKLQLIRLHWEKDFSDD